ncbi:MAG: DUF4412 domain-containing protein [Acidobacteria bacterium]|nr:DUF4412 domain-containing protein [Acidobacteriota bacterium]MDW7983674.1 DUF4412 domain-containing protein [Acidobacteriota bacterium]
MRGMNRTSRRLRAVAGWMAVGALLAVGPGRFGRAAAGFEGVIVYRLTTSDSTVDMIYHLKGNKARWEMTSIQSKQSPSGMGSMASQVYSIIDFTTGTVTTVMPAQKMYMVMNYRQMAKALSSDKTPPEKFPKVVKTGKKETIAGYPCEHWLFGEGADQFDMCLAKGLGFFGMGGPGGRTEFESGLSLIDRAQLEAQLAARPELKELVEGGAFPLKVEAKKGVGGFVMVATRIERKSLSDDLFRPPAGYQEMSWEKMMPPLRKPPQ